MGELQRQRKSRTLETGDAENTLAQQPRVVNVQTGGGKLMYLSKS
jgi:hypothetical protein